MFPSHLSSQVTAPKQGSKQAGLEWLTRYTQLFRDHVENDMLL